MPTPSELPAISVVIPSKDRPGGVASLLRDLRRQAYPAENLEICVIDDGSSPAYRLAAPGLRVIRHEQSQGAQRSRNEALAAAKNEIVFLCDDDVELLGDDCLSQAAAVFVKQPEVAAVFVRKIDVLRRGARVRELELSISRPTFYSGDLVPCRHPEGPAAWGCGIYFARRRLLLDLGGYDGVYGLNGGHSFREESDLHARLRAAGHVIWYLPRIAIKHHVTETGGHGPAVGRRLYWFAHNHLVFARRHLRYWPLRAVGFLLDVGRYTWVQGRFRHVLPMLRGYLAGWRNALRDRGPGANNWLEHP